MCSSGSLDSGPAHSAAGGERATAPAPRGRASTSATHPEPSHPPGAQPQRFSGPPGACAGAFSYRSVSGGVSPPQLPPSPAAVPRAPTSPIAEAVPHGHSLRTPIAIAPARAKTRQSPSMGTWGRPDKDPRSQRSPGTSGPTLQARAVTHPRSPSSVLWISFRTPAGPGKRRAETSRGWA